MTSECPENYRVRCSFCQRDNKRPIDPMVSLWSDYDNGSGCFEADKGALVCFEIM